uniref:Structural maintenance of chromosomes protein 5 n=1 Tax=Kalanchoe fedtschenkoi TaxID=63787 RepID=A0A7N0USJ7_KALFE
MAEPDPKRLKISRGDDGYLPGNIVEIELHNFMTFDILNCKPGPRLNLVIGPNGSGKSSIVCAIALGLAGEPQLLGRASSVAAFVKRGEESGYIKISLRGNTKEEKLTIMRKIDVHNKSEWILNGISVPKKEVVLVTQSFNIQVSNLTQFLPQDRVCEFAKLTPVDLLKETEKAVGDPQLPILHETLIEKSRDVFILERKVESIRHTLNQAKEQHAEQERDVERVRQREEFLLKAEAMKKKLPWLKYDLKKAEYMETKELEKEAKKKLDEAAKALNNLMEPIEKKKKEKKASDAECKKISNSICSNFEKRNELLYQLQDLGVRVQEKYKGMDELRRQEQNHQQRLIAAREDLASAEQQLRDLPHYEPPQADIDRLHSQIVEIECSANQKRNEKTEKDRELENKKRFLGQLRERLKEMENQHNKLLNALRNSGSDRIFEAYEWVQQHRNEFNKDVFGPVLIEVNISNHLHASYLEGHVPYYIWKSFITQDPSDRDLLVKNLKSFDVPILNYTVSGSRGRESFELSQEVRRLGISTRLDQVFDSPTAVKDVLLNQCGLEYSYVGSKEADQNAAELSRLGIMDFWTPENHYRWTTSRYGGHVSGSVEAVSKSRLLLCSAQSGEIDKLRSKMEELHQSIVIIEEEIKLMLTVHKKLVDQAAELHKQREEIVNTIQAEKRKRRDLENRIGPRRKKLESIEKEGDMDNLMAKIVEEVDSYNNQRFQLANTTKKLLIEAVQFKHNLAVKRMVSIELDFKVREMEGNIKQHEKFALQASMHLEYCKKEVEGCREQLLAAKRHAESIAIITPELQKDFLEMPTTIEELDAAIQDNISQANAILFVNQNVLKEYEERQIQIEQLTARLETEEESLKNCKNEVCSLKASWLPKLRRLVDQINENFSRNFREMAVAGEVLLDEHGTDFASFGILIKVKFRQTGQLQVLISLQDLTHCPFRVVDEINQGMDPINERKMFQQLVRAASQPNTPQCFLLTPKLLPDLVYSDACSILNVMNGPWIEQPSKVWRSANSIGAIMRAF